MTTNPVWEVRRLSRIYGDLGNGSLLMVRHGKDLSKLTIALDQPLDSSFEQEVYLLGEEIAGLVKAVGTKAIIYSSCKQRTEQSAHILADCLGIEATEIRRLPGLNCLYQGTFVMDGHNNDTLHEVLRAAWFAFYESVKEGRLEYRFGDPCEDETTGVCRYENLRGKFTKFGENQLEFSARFYRAFSTILSQPDRVLPIIVTHRAVIYRCQRLISAYNQGLLTKANPGEVVSIHESKGCHIPLDNFAEGVISSPQSREELSRIIDLEASFLEGSEKA